MKSMYYLVNGELKKGINNDYIRNNNGLVYSTHQRNQKPNKKEGSINTWITQLFFLI
jgi:hypothetical protein